MFRIKHRKVNWPWFLLQLGFYLFAFALVIKLVELQIFDPNNLKEKARNMRQANELHFRGEIVDRNGVRLATDSTLYDIYAHPAYYEDSIDEMAAKLSPVLGMSKQEIAKKLSKLDYSTITLKRNVQREVGQKVLKLGIKGIDPVKKSTRVYPQGKLASHILGYVNQDADIEAGVEKTAKKNLVSFPSSSGLEKTGRGDIIYDFNTDPESVVKPVKGKKIVLTIDSAIQHVAETELAKMVEKTKADRGTVIVMNPKNGEILGFAVLPSYDPNEYNKVNPSIVKNWVLSDVYPPGSTFKILTVASAIETGRMTEFDKVLDTGKIVIQGWTIKNYDYYKHPNPGLIDLYYLFEHSSNIGSLQVAFKMPPIEHYTQLKRFGIGIPTGIDLPGESAGIIPPAETWDRVRQATIAFGYSIASTPLQIASAVASIANDGVWVTPHVIKYSQEEYDQKIKHKRTMTAENARTMTRILEKSIRNSASVAGKIPNFTVAGKTGTSRKPNPNGPGYLEGQVFTSFVGYFPTNDPQVLIMVVVDNPKGGDAWGSTIAGPVFNEVATQVCRILKLKPDAPGLNLDKKKA